jgi:thiol-disulfide isomerase/thioredoxin
MRYCFTILTLFHFCICSGQLSNTNKDNLFELTGKLLGRDTGYIVLLYPDTSGVYVRDTCNLENGNFEFQGMIEEPSFAHLIGSKKIGNYSNFFLEAGSQNIVLEENHFDKIQMKGSKTQESNDSLQNDLNKNSEQINILENQKNKWDSVYKNQNKNYSNAQKQKLQELSVKLNKLHNKTVNIYINFIKSHPDSYVSVTELTGLLVVHRYPVNLVIPLFQALNPQIKNSRAGLYCLKEIASRSKLTSGNYLLNFHTTDVENKHISLSDFRDKYVLLDFWASWCIPCREAIPHLKQIYKQYHSSGFEIIAVSLDHNKDQWRKAIQTDSIGNWVQVLKSGELEFIFKPIQVIPQQILLDKTGKIIWSSLDDNTSTWKEILEYQLKLKSG